MSMHHQKCLLTLTYLFLMGLVEAFWLIDPCPTIRGSPSVYRVVAPVTIVFAAPTANSANESPSKPSPARYPRRAQIRVPANNPRPKNYWKELENVEREFRELWEWANVTLDDDDASSSSPPPIPNESLLNYWKRHDLRAAIRTYGGRDVLSELMRDATVIPGSWKLAVQTPYIRQVIDSDPNLSAAAPPSSPQQLRSDSSTKRGLRHSSTTNAAATTSDSPKVYTDHKPNHRTNNTTNQDRLLYRWYHSDKRKPPGYWSSERVVIQELFEYLEERQSNENIPAVWMPRLSELSHAGRDDLALAIQRFGGYSKVCRKSGLISFNEWNYVEGMYELLLELKGYLDRYDDRDYTNFPVVCHVKRRGYDRLHSLIQYYGGRKFVAARLGMATSQKGNLALGRPSAAANAGMSWGPFDLEFGIELYTFVREQHLRKKPPLRYGEVAIPSQLVLMRHGDQGAQLDQKMQEYGGYENVARRLGLAYSFQIR